MEYLLKVSAVTTIFYLCYKIFLQRDTFFEFNRTFLLLGVLAGFLIPFIIIPIYVDYTPIDLSKYATGTIIETETIEEPFNILDYIPIIYALGVIGFSTRFIIQLVALTKISAKSKHEKQARFTIVKTTKNISPFSFFRWIVYNPTLFNKEELNQILTHEKVHVKQYHSIDIIITQLSCIVLWFNPFIWLYIKDLKQNLEFIADQKAIQISECKKSYQYTLLKTSMPTHHLAITNNFYTSLIKKRIFMLQKSKSKKINLIKYTLVIPFLVVFIFNFNTKVIAQNKEKDENINITGKSDAGVVIKMKDSDNPLIIIDGKESEKSELDKLNHFNIESIDILKGESAIKTYGDKGENGVMLITTKKENKSQWKVSAKRNKNVIYATKDTIYVNKKPSILRELVNDYEKQPLYILDGKEITKTELDLIDEQTINSLSSIKGEQAKKEYGKKGENGVIIIKSRIPGARNSPYVEIVKANIYIVDGKEVKKEVFENIYPENIKSINVLKGDSAIKKYGNKCKNGVIEVTTKNGKWETNFIKEKSIDNVKVTGYGKTSDSTRTIKVSSSAKGESPLVIVDGKEYPYEKIENINPDDIEAINVLKDESATKKYGDKGKHGVIVVTTKKNISKSNSQKNFYDVKVIGYGKTSDSIKNKSHISIRARSAEKGESPLVIVDGKEYPHEKLETINPDNIDSINVLKDEKATEIYGDKGKNGVVMITTKDTEWKTQLQTGKDFDSIRKSIIENSTIPKNALYVVDGKETNIKAIKRGSKLDEKIKAINIIKGEEAFKKYGNKGKDGVVEIITKK